MNSMTDDTEKTKIELREDAERKAREALACIVGLITGHEPIIIAQGRDGYLLAVITPVAGVKHIIGTQGRTVAALKSAAYLMAGVVGLERISIVIKDPEPSQVDDSPARALSCSELETALGRFLRAVGDDSVMLTEDKATGGGTISIIGDEPQPFVRQLLECAATGISRANGGRFALDCP